MKQLSSALREVVPNLFNELQPIKDSRKRVRFEIETKDGFVFKAYGMYEKSKWGEPLAELDPTSLRLHRQGLGKKPDLTALVESGLVKQKGAAYFVPYGG